MIRVLIVEDDSHIRKLYEDTLKDEKFRVTSVSNGEEALDKFNNQSFDIAIIDIMMPKMDGLTLVNILRNNDITIPMIIVSAKGEHSNIKDGFRVGVDDYMVKPIDMEELVLRIKALLKRAKISISRKIEIGNVLFDYDSHLVLIDNKPVNLPKKEFLLIYRLLSYPNKIFTRSQLLEDIWGSEVDSDEFTINVHINRLRNKFKDRKEFKIETVKGLGYKVSI